MGCLKTGRAICRFCVLRPDGSGETGRGARVCDRVGADAVKTISSSGGITVVVGDGGIVVAGGCKRILGGETVGVGTVVFTLGDGVGTRDGIGMSSTLGDGIICIGGVISSFTLGDTLVTVDVNVESLGCVADCWTCRKPGGGVTGAIGVGSGANCGGSIGAVGGSGRTAA